MSYIFYIDSMAPSGGQERVVASHISFVSNESPSVYLVVKDSGQSYYSLPAGIKIRALKFTRVHYSIRIFRIINLFFRSIIASVTLRRILNDISPSLIYVSSPLNFFEVVISGWPISKIVVSEHSSFYAHNFFYRLIIKFLYKGVRSFFVPSQTDSIIYTKLGLPHIYLPNPLPNFGKVTPGLQRERVVLSIGRYVGDKRQEELLHIWGSSRLPETGWRLLLVGEGPLREKLKNIIDELNISGSVSLIRPVNDIERLYSSASIFALTSRTEGFGLVIAEALHFGLPCVSYDVPVGPRDLIIDNTSGFLVPDGDRALFIDRLEFLAYNLEQRNRISKTGKAFIDDFLNRDDIERKFCKAFFNN